MGRLLVIFTGGTIASGFEGDGKGPSSRASQRLRASLQEICDERGLEPLFREPLGQPGLDSSELDPGHWQILTAQIASELRQGLSGVLVLHGTDTMANTASWLSLCFSGLSIPVILTGSQLTLDYMAEDVTTNLRGAVQACCAPLQGVWIYFNWKLIPGSRGHKEQAQHPDAFRAINGRPLYFNPDWALAGSKGSSAQERWDRLPPELERILQEEPQEHRRRCEKIRWLLAQPGTFPVLSGQELLLGLVGYGSGNVPSGLQERIAGTYGDQKPLIVACSQAEEGMKRPDGYASVGAANLTQRGFRVWSQMDRSLEFVHSLCCFALMASPQDPGAVLSRYLLELRRP